MKTVIRNSYTPKTGDYCETIVVDKESGDAYIFDCDGIFTPMPQPVDVEDILRRAAEYTDETVAPLEEKLDTIEEGAQVNVIETITQNGHPLTITDKTVNVTVPTKTSDIENDGSDGTDTYVESSTLDDYYTKSETDTQIGYETDAREIADAGLQEQIDAIVASSDVVDIVGTYAALQAYDTSKLHDNDIIKVLTDETRDDATTYYRWDADTSTWSYIGAEGPFYTKAESDALFTPMTRTINNKALSSDITLTAADVHALPDSTVIPTVNDATLTIQKNGTDVATFTANSASNQTANITVPTDTSDLTNDGDGQSPFATEDYVDLNGGKIDTIEVNGTAQPIVNKTVDITVPTRTSDLTNDGDGNSTYVETDDLGAAAFSNQYADLDGLPTIPTVNDATLTIQKNGTDVATFTANSATNQTANITVPVNTSDLTNDSGFITSSALSNYYTKSETYSQGEVNNLINSLSIPTKTSDLTNDSGFISEDDLYSEACGSGTTITFQDAPDNAPLSDFKLKGETSQNGTPTPDAPVAVQTVTGENVVKITGKNLYEWSDTEWSNPATTASWCFQNGSSTAGGGAYGANITDRTPYKITLPAGTYKATVYNISSNIVNIQACKNGTSAEIIITSPTNMNSSNPTSTITLTEQTTLCFRYRVTNPSLGIGDTKIQVERDSATAYEPYQEQSYEVNLGKNLYDKDSADYNVYLGSESVAVSAQGNGWSIAIPVEVGQTYTFSRQFTTGQVSNTYYAFIVSTPAAGVAYIGGRQSLGTGTTFTATAPTGAKYLIIYYAWDATAAQKTDAKATFQIEIGSQATDFAAYFTPIELCKIGDYQDYIYKSGEKWYVRKEIGSYTFDGSEAWSRSGSTTSAVFVAATGTYLGNYIQIKMGTGSQSLFDRFIFNSHQAEAEGRFNLYNGTDYYQSLVISFDITDIPDITAAKAWLASNTPTFYGILATPTDTEITNEALVAQLEAILSQGYTYAGTNNITTVIAAGNEQGELEVCYTKTILPIATETSLGIVQIGSGLSITANGVLSVASAGSVDWDDVTNRPTNVSYWTNDAGYITSAAIPTNVSSFTNDAGYITSAAIPANVSAFTNDAGYITNSALSNYYTKSQTYSQQEVNALINTIAIPTKTSDLTNDGADGTSTYVEADELGATAFSNSFNDLTDKPIIGNATITIQKNGASAGTFTTNATANKSINITVPTKTSDITNDSGFITGIPTASASTLGGIKVGDNLSIDANGVLSADAESITVDSALSTSSPNPVQNSVITAALNNKANSADLATVATSGSYNDLSDKPTIPTVNNGTLTIQKNGTNVQTFTANSATNKTANIQVPNLQTSNTDPGEGSALAADTFLGIYDIAPEDVDGARLVDGSVTSSKIDWSTIVAGVISIGTMAAGRQERTVSIPTQANTDYVVLLTLAGAMTGGWTKISLSVASKTTSSFTMVNYNEVGYAVNNVAINYLVIPR